VLERPLQGAPWTFDCHNTGFDRTSQILGDFYSLLRVDLLHPESCESILVIFLKYV
jgi:hypothetical protein